MEIMGGRKEQELTKSLVD